jgi:very-short-patch-repair endonuclease
MKIDSLDVAFGEGRDGVGLEWKSTMPPKRTTPKILRRAGELRKQTTPAETKLWLRLRLMREDTVRFRRQHAIGNYVVDFCAPRQKLIIELDGSQHLEQQEYDQERTRYLESHGYQVIRFWHNEVMKGVEGVLLAILQEFEEQS